MATVGTIAVNLTANTQQLSGGLQSASNQLQTFQKDVSRTGGISAGAAAGILELSRGVEDFAVGFQTNGLQGALRGSLNNIAAFATLVGGPLAGAVAGFASVGLSVLVSWFSKTSTSAAEAKKQLEDWNATLRDMNKVELEAVRSQQALESLTTSDAAGNRIKQLQDQMALNRTEFRGVVAMDYSDESLRRRIELTNEARQLEMDIEATRKRQIELAAKEKQQAEDTLAIRQFYAEIAKNRKDAVTGQGIVLQQMGQVSGGLADEFRKSLQIRELQNLNLPPEMQDALAGVIGGAFGGPMNPGRAPSFVQAGTQQAAVLQQQDAERQRQAERERETIQVLKDIYDVLEEQRRDNTPVQNDAIDLN